MLPLIGLIPLLPLLGFLVCGLLGKRLSRAGVSAVACGSVLLAFLVSLGAVLSLGSGGQVGREGAGGTGAAGENGAAPHSYEIAYWTWIPDMPFAGESTASPGGHSEGDVSSGSSGSIEQSEALGVGTVTRSAREAPPSPGHSRPLRIAFGFRLDALSCVMILIITGVGFLIHVYSTGYMAHDPGYARYFAYLNLFTAMMLTLVLAGNFLVMFVGWEGVGLCSYLLIGFWFEDVDKAQAGRKAFITNRIGDFAFILGMLALLVLFHSLDFSTVMASIAIGGVPAGMLTAIALALFIGACGKSAQIPLYVWLPDAMAGPTPVSALIHAATMVTAGVYMVCRCSVLFLHAPAALMTVAMIGAATALFAATIGIAQNDIKKVLAYSTVSQLGYMFLGAGVGAFTASVFHLMTHAFFKALLFLGAGSVIHAMSGEQDMRRMGGLRRRMPWTYTTMLVGALAIAGFPLFSGFFSKDEILWKAWSSGSKVLWGIGLIAAALTAFYMFRLIFLTFHGAFRGSAEQDHHVHESPASMTIPLALLAVAALAGGWIGIPRLIGAPLGIPNAFEHYLEPVFEAGSGVHAPLLDPHATGIGASEPDRQASSRVTDLGRAGDEDSQTELLLMALTTTVGLGGIFTAWAIYRKPRAVAAASTAGWPVGSHAASRADSAIRDAAGEGASSTGPVQRLLAHAYYVDDLYAAIVLKPYERTCEAFQSFDRWVVDGLVNAIAAFTELIGQLLRLFQTGFVRNYALLLFLGAVLLVWVLAR